MNLIKASAGRIGESFRSLSHELRMGDSIMRYPTLIAPYAVAAAALLLDPQQVMDAYTQAANFLHLNSLGNLADGFRAAMAEAPRTMYTSALERGMSAIPMMVAVGSGALVAEQTLFTETNIIRLESAGSSLLAYSRR